MARVWEEHGGKTPVYAINPESDIISNRAIWRWFLNDELFVQDGIILEVGQCRLNCVCLCQCVGAVYRGMAMSVVVALL